jgi:hypothetical protein
METPVPVGAPSHLSTEKRASCATAAFRLRSWPSNRPSSRPPYCLQHAGQSEQPPGKDGVDEMVESGDYFFFAISPNQSVTAFRSEIGQNNLARRGSSYTNFRKALTDFSNMVILVRESSELGPLGDNARRSVAPESITSKSRRKKEGMVEAPDSLSRPETQWTSAARELRPRDQ